MKLLIGLAGSAGSGKDTVHRIISEHWYPEYYVANLKFASELINQVCRAFQVSSDIFTNRELKGKPCAELWNLTPRQVLQFYGTEFARNLIRDDIWVEYVRNSLPELSDSKTIVVVTDVRFPNEAEMIREEGGEIWKIHRNETAATHESEKPLPEELIDWHIQNKGTMEELRAAVHKLTEYHIIGDT